MGRFMCLSLIYVIVTLSPSAGEIFDDFQKCRVGPTFNECLVKAMNALLPLLKDGNKEYDIQRLEPLNIPHVVFEQQSTGAIQIRQEYDNTTLYNFGTKTTFTKVNADLDKNTIIVELRNPLVKMHGNYKIRGKILLLPLNSDGEYNAEFRDVFVKFVLKYKKVKRNGNVHWHFTEAEAFMKPGDVLLNAENLVNGQKELSDELNNLINENWKDLWDEIEPTYAKLIGKVLLNIINKAFRNIVVDQVIMGV